MTFIFGQCDDTTRTKIPLDTSYKANCEAGELIKFLIRDVQFAIEATIEVYFLELTSPKSPNIIIGRFDL